jgi:hypothetical protein
MAGSYVNDFETIDSKTSGKLAQSATFLTLFPASDKAATIVIGITCVSSVVPDNLRNNSSNLVTTISLYVLYSPYILKGSHYGA